MTLHIVLGEGEMPAKELTAALDDLKKRDETADVNHWWYVQGKAEPTSTDKGMLAWMNKYNVWYGMVTSDGSSVDDIYKEAVETHEAKRLVPTVLELLQLAPDEGEDADLLVLFASDDYSAPSDQWLNDVGRAVQDAGFPVLALNDGLVEMDFSDVEPPEEDDDTPEPTPIKSKRAAATPVEEDASTDEAAAAPGQYTRDQLEEMDLSKLKEIAADLGITLAPRTRIPTYINAILGESSEPGEVEDDEPEPLQTGQTTMTAPINTGTTYGSSTSTGILTGVTAPAMMIVIYNGSVVARPISSDEALQLLARAN